MPENTVAMWQAMFAFGLFLFVPQAVMQVQGNKVEPGDFPAMVPAALVASLAVVAFACWQRRSLTWAGRGSLPLTLWSYPLLMLAWVPLAMFAYPEFLHGMGMELPAQSPVQYFVDDPFNNDSLPLPLALALVCVVGPIAEELVFRGFLFRWLALLAGKGTALALTSILFGLMHGLIYALPITLLGLYFGYLRQRSLGLAGPILAHMLHNSLTVGITLCFPEFVARLYS